MTEIRRFELVSIYTIQELLSKRWGLCGWRVTKGMIGSLVISRQQMGTREIVVLHYTGCRAQTFENKGFFQYLKKELGVDVGD